MAYRSENGCKLDAPETRDCLRNLSQSLATTVGSLTLVPRPNLEYKFIFSGNTVCVQNSYLRAPISCIYVREVIGYGARVPLLLRRRYLMLCVLVREANLPIRKWSDSACPPQYSLILGRPYQPLTYSQACLFRLFLFNRPMIENFEFPKCPRLTGSAAEL